MKTKHQPWTYLVLILVLWTPHCQLKIPHLNCAADKWLCPGTQKIKQHANKQINYNLRAMNAEIIKETYTEVQRYNKINRTYSHSC
jgi:hypothetical protein